jgi:hypothetical protein
MGTTYHQCFLEDNSACEVFIGVANPVHCSKNATDVQHDKQRLLQYQQTIFMPG